MIHMLNGPGVAVVQVAGSDFDVSVFLRQQDLRKRKNDTVLLFYLVFFFT